jgi:hypothetical protein
LVEARADHRSEASPALVRWCFMIRSPRSTADVVALVLIALFAAMLLVVGFGACTAFGPHE